MASKNTQIHIKKDNVTIKWVKRAQMWCRTTIKDNKQTQEWFSKNAKPSLSEVTQDIHTQA
jgi:hypothetical protein